jgi:oligosaccharide repeat unit polymerase
MLVSLVQFAIVFVRLRPIKTSTVFRLAAVFGGVVLLFGVIGDYRSGSSDLIRKWAQPTDNYPDWLPSGVLWAYVYAATPVNNLLYTAEVSTPLNNMLFPNTAATLFPSVLRDALYGDNLGQAESGELVDSVFNVSTAYIGPYQDFGFIGIALFSVVTAFACMRFWHQNDLKSVLIYVVLSQCLILSLFWNQFLSLPIITQIFWLEVFLRPRYASKNKMRAHNTILLISSAGL